MATQNPSNILIVEDERNIAFLLAQALRRAAPGAYDVHISYTAEEAMALMPNYDFELVISDLRLPGMTGLELLAQIRAGYSNTRTMLMTGYGSDKVEADARRIANAYLTKPFHLPEVIKLVEKVMSSPADPPVEKTKRTPALPTLPSPVSNPVQRQLEELRLEAGAVAALLVNLDGRALVRAGEVGNVDQDLLNSLLVKAVQVSGELANTFREPRAFDINFYDGEKYEVYLRQVDATSFIAVLLDVRVTTARTGAVRLYLKRVVDIIRDPAATKSVPAPTSKTTVLKADVQPAPQPKEKESIKPTTNSTLHANSNEPANIEMDDKRVITFEQAVRMGLLANFTLNEPFLEE